MSRPVRRLLGRGAGLLLPLALACGRTSSSRATMATPHAEESPDVGPGEGEPRDSLPLTDSTVTAPPPDPAPIETPSALPDSKHPALTATEVANIKGLLIQASIAEYNGSCPCPYSVARDGSSCGRRSAYSRAGGEEPLCYPDDVSDELVYGYWASQQ